MIIFVETLLNAAFNLFICNCNKKKKKSFFKKDICVLCMASSNFIIIGSAFFFLSSLLFPHSPFALLLSVQSTLMLLFIFVLLRACVRVPIQAAEKKAETFGSSSDGCEVCVQ